MCAPADTPGRPRFVNLSSGARPRDKNYRPSHISVRVLARSGHDFTQALVSVSKYFVNSLINIMLLVLDEAEHSVQVTPYSADSNRNSCNIWLQAQ